MNKLLQIIGQEAYDLLKVALGDGFEAFEKQFEDGEISEDDVRAKQEELGIQVNNEEEPESEEVKEVEETEEVKEVDENEEVEEVEEEGVADEPTVSVLGEGWLLEDGEVDYDKISDEVLKGYIKGLNGRLKQSEWDYKYKMAIMLEAMKSNMYDTSDADRYISMGDLSIDDDGNVVGVKEAFDKLRESKPHLFKSVVIDGSNPVDTGFNPVDKKVTGKPRSYAEAVEQTRALKTN